MDPARSLETAERALRDLYTAVMFKEHGANWMDQIDPGLRARWVDVRQKEASQRAGHVLSGVSDLDYAFLGDLVDLIKSRGNWARLFEPILGDKNQVFALFDLLQRARRPVDHARPLLPFEEELASGIAGYIRNRVTIYLSDQDPDGDYYPRVERIEDNFGNVFSYSAGISLGGPIGVPTKTVLRVGDQVSFRCIGSDPQGRTLQWRLRILGRAMEPIEGDQADVPWDVLPIDTGPDRAAMIELTFHGDYHRNVGGHQGLDALIIFRYAVIPPA
jgi:hypothetical protein